MVRTYLEIPCWWSLSDSCRLPKGLRKRKSIKGLKKRTKRPAALRAGSKVLLFAQLEESPCQSTLSSCLQSESPIQKPKKSIDGVRSRWPIPAKFPSAATIGSPRHTSCKKLSSLPPFQAQIRYITQTTVQKKWSPFLKPAKENIQKVLRLVERSVIGRFPGDMAKIVAQKAIKPVAERFGPYCRQMPGKIRVNNRKKAERTTSSRSFSFHHEKRPFWLWESSPPQRIFFHFPSDHSHPSLIMEWNLTAKPQIPARGVRA